jgi:hypothetical protein
MPLVIGFGGACAVAAAIGYTYHERAIQAAANAQRDAEKAEPANGASILNGAPAGGEVRSAIYRPAPSPPAALEREPTTAAPPADRVGGSPSQGDDDATKARREAWQNYYAQLAQLRKDRLTAAQSAMTADTSAGDRGRPIISASAGGAPASPPAPAEPAQGFSGGPGAAPGGGTGVPGVYGTGVAGYPIYPPAQIDAAGQREKQAFLAQPGATGDADYLQATRRDPISPYEVGNPCGDDRRCQ